MGVTLEQWRATIGGFPGRGKGRRRRRRRLIDNLEEFLAEVQIKREAGQVNYTKSIVLNNKLTLVIMQIWRRIFVTLMELSLWFFLSCCEIQLTPLMAVPHDFTTSTPTQSLIDIINVGGYNTSLWINDAAYSLLVILVLLVRAGLETNPGPPMNLKRQMKEFNSRKEIKLRTAIVEAKLVLESNNACDNRMLLDCLTRVVRCPSQHLSPQIGIEKREMIGKLQGQMRPGLLGGHPSTPGNHESVRQELLDQLHQQSVPSTSTAAVPLNEPSLERPVMFYEGDLHTSVGMTNRGNYCFVIAAFNILASAPQFLQALQPMNRRHFKKNSQLVPLLSRILNGEIGKEVAAHKLRNLVAEFHRNDGGTNEFDDGHQKDAHNFLLALLDLMESECVHESTLCEELFGIRLTKKWSCNNPLCNERDVHTEQYTERTLSLAITEETATLSDAYNPYIAPEELPRNCACGEKISLVIKQYSSLPNLIPIHLKRYGNNLTKNNNPIIPLKFWYPDDITQYVLTGLVNHLGKTMSAGHYIAVVPDRKGKLLIVDDDNIFPVVNNTAIDKYFNNGYVLMYSKTSTQQASKRRSQAIDGQEGAIKKPKISSPEIGKQQNAKDSPAGTTLVDFIHNLNARLPVPLATPPIESLKKKDFKQLCPHLGLVYSKNKSVKAMQAEVAGNLFDKIMSALHPLRSVPLQGLGVTPNKNKSQHIGQLRQAFKNGSNELQTKIFKELQMQSENPLPEVGVCPDHQDATVKLDMNWVDGVVHDILTGNFATAFKIMDQLVESNIVPLAQRLDIATGSVEKVQAAARRHIFNLILQQVSYEDVMNALQHDMLPSIRNQEHLLDFFGQCTPVVQTTLFNLVAALVEGTGPVPSVLDPPGSLQVKSRESVDLVSTIAPSSTLTSLLSLFTFLGTKDYGIWADSQAQTGWRR